MHINRLVFAAGLFAFAAQAQQLDPALPGAARLGADSSARPAAPPGPLAEGFKRYEALYGGNEAANPNDRQFSGFRTDPRLVIGYAFTRNFAIEAGYAHLRDEGFHKIAPEPVEQAVAAGALGAKSHTTHIAAKVTLPLGERLNAWGKLGVAHSQVKDDGFQPPDAKAAGHPLARSGRGGYGAIGAKYKLNERTTLSAEARNNISTNMFGGASNDTSVRGSVGIGF